MRSVSLSLQDLADLTERELGHVPQWASRKRYYSSAIPEGWLTMFTHDTKLPWGYLEKDDRGKVVLVR